jgi:hypothetical protein
VQFKIATSIKTTKFVRFLDAEKEHRTPEIGQDKTKPVFCEKSL